MMRDLDSDRIANATNETEAHKEIEVTPEMIEAAVSGLRETPGLEIFDLTDAMRELIAEIVLERALLAARGGTDKV
jgi:hypothetical protein